MQKCKRSMQNDENVLTELGTGSVPKELQQPEEQNLKDFGSLKVNQTGQEFCCLSSKSSRTDL